MVKVQRKINFINKCGCIVDCLLLEKAILTKANGFIVVSKKYI
jgi:hypothetical protein